MTQFVVRARAAPVDAGRFLAAVGQGAGVEYLADVIRHALFVSQDHRQDVTLHLVLEKSADFSRTLTIRGDCLGSVPDLHEAALLSVIAEALDAGRGLGREAAIVDARGVTIRAVSFEKLVKELAALHPVFVMSPGGDDIREVSITDDAVFVMTDHIPMPKNSYKSMARQGVRSLRVGPVMLHTCQCITVIHNELDRRG